uniref:Uncharacterized protein n=1 Tax=Trichogramma kaykai TaxID=54128 RepID=A0ABD2XCV8_9HYME
MSFIHNEKKEPDGVYDNENVDGEIGDQASDTKNLDYFRYLHESTRLIDAPIAACDAPWARRDLGATSNPCAAVHST